MAELVIRRIKDNSEVHRVKLNSLSEGHVERVIGGLLINMNKDEFYVDDSEVDKARTKGRIS